MKQQEKKPLDNDIKMSVSIWILLINVVAILLVAMYMNNIEIKKTIEKIREKIEHDETIDKDTIKVIIQDSLTKENVYKEIKNRKFKFPKITMAQIILESGHLASNLTRENNNIAGMKFPRQRETKAIKELNGYAYFKSWQDCIIDLRIYEQTYLCEMTKEDYLSYLGRIYAEDNKYVSKVIQIANSIDFD